MKRLFILFIILLIVESLISGAGDRRLGISKSGEGDDIRPTLSAIKGPRLTVNPNFGKVPLYFIPNRGQVNKRAKFYAKTSRYTLWMTREGLVFDSIRRVENEAMQPTPAVNLSQKEKIERDVSRLVFLNANKNVEIVPVMITQHKVNYYIGNDPTKWQKGISTSRAVLYKDIYNNIDLKVYGKESQIEYDWIVKPGGNPDSIRLKYINVKGTLMDKNGNLLIETKFGELLHKKPVSFQLINGNKVKVESDFQRVDKNSYGFKVNKFSRDYDLIIDPVVSLDYSTYLGGGHDEISTRMVVDDSGQVHLTGYTYSSDFPIKNAYQGSKASSSYDAILTKFNSSGSDLIFSTYFGGSSGEYFFGIAVANNGDVYIAGDTFSSDLPAINSRIGGKDVFIARFDSSGNFLAGRYLGGSNEDRNNTLILDNSGHILESGWTRSWDFPTVNPYQSMLSGSISAFISKLTPDLSSIEYSTYLGGTGRDEGSLIVIDNSGYFYVCGRTTSKNFPLKKAWQNSHGGGQYDVFLTKFEPDGSDLVFSTYLGGSGDDCCLGLVLSNSGDINVGGHTNSIDFPTVNPYQYNNCGDDDIFISKFNHDGSKLLYSTYLGGTGEDWHGVLALDNSGYLYITGSTYSTDFPSKIPYQQTYSGSRDAFLSILSPDGTDIIFSTFFGGSGWDQCRNISRDCSGNIYLTGVTMSWDLPMLNSYQTTMDGNRDFFVARFSINWNLTVLSIPEAGIPINVIPEDTNGNGDGNTNFTRIYPLGETVTLNAPGTYNQMVFYRWTIDGVENFNRSIQVTMNRDHTVSVEYQVPVITHTLSIQSTPDTGVPVAVTPKDINGKGDGNTNFTRTYNQGEIVSLIAPETFNGKDFYQWTIDGVENFSRNIQVTMDRDHSVAVIYESPPAIYLSRNKLNFGACPGIATTGSQSFFIGNTGGLPLNWTISDDSTWLNCSPAHGTNFGEVSVSVNGSGLDTGVYTGTVKVIDPHAGNSPQEVIVTLTVYNTGNTKEPFGYFETPWDGASVMSSISVSGWVLDDIEVMSVKIYRKGDKNLVYIGDAVFVDGARPDVELAYPAYPKSYRAGWGYMMLTNFLPDGGNGTFKLYAIAMDKEGHQVTLGTKTIHCDNAHAVKPFGAIDTPDQGGNAWGRNFRNQGWVLTPLPHKIPEDGHTIIVWIDGLDVGKCKYNIYRSDIASLFPGYENSNGAMAYFDFDATTYKNGVHTIQWTAMDNAGNVDGIGSRYFSIQNTGGSAVGMSMAKRTELNAVAFNVPPSILKRNVSEIPLDYAKPVRIKTGYDRHIKPHQRFPDETGKITIEIKELERLEIDLGGSANWWGFQLVGDQLRNLPIGSFLDTRKGIFTWMPGPGFLRTYQFVFLEERENQELNKILIDIHIFPGFTDRID